MKVGRVLTAILAGTAARQAGAFAVRPQSLNGRTNAATQLFKEGVDAPRPNLALAASATPDGHDPEAWRSRPMLRIPTPGAIREAYQTGARIGHNLADQYPPGRLDRVSRVVGGTIGVLFSPLVESANETPYDVRVSDRNPLELFISRDALDRVRERNS